MTTASKITLVRVAFIPAFMVLMYLSGGETNLWMWLSLGVFILASVTDYIDGYIARKYNQTSDFGKFLDPLADKLLVISAMTILCQWGRMPAWALMIVLAREFSVTGLRLVAVGKGNVIAAGWTKPGRITISGASNGGLLMSTLVTMRPDLWGCVIDSVPHTDMIHFSEDDRGPMYVTEYGNPRDSKEMFEYLLSYSPYHNVKPVEYPWVYVQTGELDNNVPPYHGKKFAARMQAENRSDNPILLRVLAEGSHDRGKGEVYWRTIAEMQLFMKHALNK